MEPRVRRNHGCWIAISIVAEETRLCPVWSIDGATWPGVQEVKTENRSKTGFSYTFLFSGQRGSDNSSRSLQLPPLYIPDHQKRLALAGIPLECHYLMVGWTRSAESQMTGATRCHPPRARHPWLPKQTCCIEREEGARTETKRSESHGRTQDDLSNG